MVQLSVTDTDDFRSIYARTTSGTGQVHLLGHSSNANCSFTITEEWQRFEVSSVGGIPTHFYAVDFREAGTTLSEVIIWGAQAEEGSYPTSYIPTYGSSVTRGADFKSQNDLIDTPYVFEANDNFTFMYEGSFFRNTLESKMICGGGYYASGSTYKSYWRLQTDINKIQLRGDNEVLMADASYTFPPVNTNAKYLVRKSNGVIDFFVNGTKITTNQATPNSRFDLRSVFWSYIPTNYQVSGKTKQFLVFETGLTDSECIALTTL